MYANSSAFQSLIYVTEMTACLHAGVIHDGAGSIFQQVRHSSGFSRYRRVF